MVSSTSRNGVLFIANREALVLSAYPDGTHCSVGFGTNDPMLKPGDTISVRHAFDLLKNGVAQRDKILGRAIKVPVSQQQWDALSSFYYQNAEKVDDTGRPGFTTMMKLINAGSFDEAADYFKQCRRNSKGEPKDGLLKRRLLETTVFLKGDYGSLDPIPYWPGAPVGPPRPYHLQPGDF